MGLGLKRMEEGQPRPYLHAWARERYPFLYLLQGPKEDEVQPQVVSALKSMRVTVWETDAGGKKTLARLARVLNALPIPKRLIGSILSAVQGFLPPGHPDLTGYLQDGRALFIECKSPEKLNSRRTQDRAAGRPSPEQLTFLDRAHAAGCVVGVCWSPQDAVEIIRAAGTRPTN